jgi:hypothetical protein
MPVRKVRHSFADFYEIHKSLISHKTKKKNVGYTARNSLTPLSKLWLLLYKLSINSQRLDKFLLTTPAPNIFQIGLKTQNNGAQFYLGSNVKYFFTTPIFMKIKIAEQY